MTDYYFKRHDSVLSPDVAAETSSYIDSLLNTEGHNWSTNFGWMRGDHTDDYERYDNLCLVHRVYDTNKPLYEKIVGDLRKLYPNWEPEHPSCVQFYVWTGGSCIEWHTDVVKSERSGAITIYLNRYWDIEWGGEFLYKDQEDKTQRVSPEYNLGVAIREVHHRSTKIQGRHFRKCVQIFMKDVDS